MLSKKLKSHLLVGAALVAAGMSASAFAKADQQRVIVKFQPGAKAAVEKTVKAAGGHLKVDLSRFDAMAISVPEAALNGLRNNPNVLYVEEDVKRKLLSTNEFEPNKPYGIEQVQADLVSDAAAGNRTVCIIDSGIDLGHPDLPSATVTGSFDSGTGNWYEDFNHHGTHVAGTISALANGSGVVGVMPNGTINLHIVKVFNADGWGYSSSLVAAASECENAGANVINMSLGGTRASRTEDQAFASLYANGILSIAAAGNDGNTRDSYPASYDSVVSVAAIDSNKQVASFSQQTSQVELSGPGVAVLSTVPRGTGQTSSANVAGTDFDTLAMEGSPQSSATGLLSDCGIGDAPCANAQGDVCLIQRGTISFAEKVQACEAGGGVAAIIYNNEAGPLSGTLGTTVTSIPSVGVSDTAGAQLLNLLGQTASVSVEASDWAYFDGTSMATPHVVGVAALVWSQFPECTAPQIRQVLDMTAEDLGTAGRDNAYGFGLVQAKAAVDELTSNGCPTVSTGGTTGGNGRGKGGKGGPKNTKN